ncbi:aerolysin [Paenibacillus sp. J31TS4]|uniref:S8 family peptidase n=1 Tax=Paenibacillus sp. J31TS4 TaxID=2807195 RepID=UPI001B17F558|nr:S8 family peptidase [Paenibacillus sp. J31TS4]GIP37556.1 aerolysin [Paenibacillus sp. J31TS4]
MSSLSKLLKEALAQPPSAAQARPAKLKRHLLVFHTEKGYRLCLKHLRANKVHPFKAIRCLRAVLCRFPLHADLTPLRQHALVKRVEADRRLRIHNVGPRSGSRARLHASCASNRPPQVVPWGIRRIGAPLLFSRNQGKQIRVAVLDTGIARHPDLKIAGGVNTIDGGSSLDDNGHGTHVAGTIAALNNRFGVVGAAPRASLYAVKAFNQFGTGYVSDLVEGIDWCIRNRMQVINMSFGLLTNSPSLRTMIRKAHKQGIVLTASAGNNGAKSGGLDYPARYPETIAVAASTREGRIASFSSRGAGIDVAAPGQAICSTYLNRGYASLDGTSMACPHASGTAALLLRANPRLTPARVKKLMKATARPLKGYSPLAQGAGVLNAARAVRLA